MLTKRFYIWFCTTILTLSTFILILPLPHSCCHCKTTCFYDPIVAHVACYICGRISYLHTGCYKGWCDDNPIIVDENGSIIHVGDPRHPRYEEEREALPIWER